MDKKTFGIILVTAIVAALAVNIVLSLTQPKKEIRPFGAGITVPTQQAFATTSTVTVTTASTLIQATTSRTYMTISNGGPQSVWLSFTGNAAVINQGVLLTASSSYEISIEKGNPYYGAITGISAGAGSSILSITGF